MMLTCPVSKLDALLEAMAAQASLYLPVDHESGAKFEKWTPGVTLSRALNTVRSAKDFFFPQSETLMNFKVSGKNIELIDTRRESEDFIIFGVRACDVRSFDVLDRVFLADVSDSYYASRREHGVIVSLACTRPAETCFCGTFGIDAANPGGDIAAWMTEDSLYCEANTEKGSALLASLGGFFTEGDAAPVDEQKKTIAARMAKLPLAGLSADKFGAGKTEEYFKSPAWADLSEACLGCGTCTFVCPTCQCYDIKDFDTGHGVCRFRCWDSCMYSEFTKMSAGQPRTSQLERFRQRFMHKLVYYPENNDGMFSCVGCGRCLVKCPISMNIVKVMKTLGGEEK